MIYTQKDAIAFANLFERLAIPCKLHIALGGSCLHKGESSKDIDLFVYAHKPPMTEDQLHRFIGALGAAGFPLAYDPNDCHKQRVGDPQKRNKYWRDVIKIAGDIDLFVMGN